MECVSRNTIWSAPGGAIEHDALDVGDLIVDDIELAQLHAHDAVLAPAHDQLDEVIAELIGRRAVTPDLPVDRRMP